MTFTRKDIDLYTYAVKAMLTPLIENEIPFFTIMDTKDPSWDPALPESISNTQDIVLIHIANDSLMDSNYNEETDTVTLRIAISTDEGISLHDYYIDDIARIKGIFQDKDGMRADPIYIVPDFMEQAIEDMKLATSQEQHSLNHFLKNPNNAKFFK
jgi:hypothetical protein